MHTEVVIHLMNAYCGVGAKSVAHLMKFYLLQWEVMKVKLEDRSQKKKIMFLHSKNKASRKGYKGEC